MRIIVAGSRGLCYRDTVLAILNCGWTVTSIVSGMCPDSPDEHAVTWAELIGLPVIPYPADWKQYGKRAGVLRNQKMAQTSKADACLVIWDGTSKGSANMVDEAERVGLPTLLVGVMEDRND